MLLQALCITSKPSVNSTLSYSPETLNSGQNWRFFVPCDLEIWWKTLQNNRAPLLCYFKLCALFQTISEFKLEWQSGNVQFRSKSAIFLSRDLEIWWMTLQKIGHLFYAATNFVHHFIAISELKLELKSRNAQFGSKPIIFLAVWPWNLMDDLQIQ